MGCVPDDIVIRLLEFIDNPALMMVDDACAALGHPIERNRSGCFCRKKSKEED